METSKTCISCHKEVIDQFCQHCGEAVSPRPINLKTFFTDVLAETVSFETPFLFTLKSILKGPGAVPRKYIAGSRKVFAKPLSFFILMTGINYLLASWIIDSAEMIQIAKSYMQEMFQQMPAISSEQIEEMIAMNDTTPLSQEKIRQLYFLMPPFLAFFSWVFFRKSKYNFMENLVATLYIQGGTLLFAIINVLAALISMEFSFHFATAVNIISMIYIVWGIYQFHQIKSAGSVFKALFVYVLAMLAAGGIFYSIQSPFI